MGKQRKSRQTELPFRPWGGKRAGAGRKPKGARAGVSHGTRPAHAARHPVHVTVRLRAGLPSLRRARTHRVLLHALGAGSERFGFRLVHYSVQTNHLHLIAEAAHRRALTRGMQGLSIRIARALNRLWGRAGRVFADRYHAHVLRFPREVRNALRYVLHDARHHGARIDGVDALSSGRWFDGWREARHVAASPLALARSWLLARGWRRRGLISIAESPR